MRKRAFDASTKSDLVQQVLRDDIPKAGDADDAGKGKFDEAVPNNRRGHLGSEPLSPGRLDQCETDLDDRFALDVIQKVKADALAARALDRHPGPEARMLVV